MLLFVISVIDCGEKKLLMAAFIPIGATCRASIVYLLDNQRVVNTLHFNKVAPPLTLNDMQGLATALHTWYTASLKPNLATGIALAEINVVDLTTQTAPTFLLSISPVEPGTGGVSVMPGNVAWCASLRTLARGRSFRGRFYVPGMPSNSVTFPNSVFVSWAGQIQTALAQLLTPANVANLLWVIASRYFNKLPRASGIVTPVASITGDLTLDSQRRRLPGRGS